MFGSRLIRRIEHFGSTAVPGLAAKPIIDMLVEVPSLRAAKLDVAPVLCAAGYEYFWRPTFGDNVPPWYAFFISATVKVSGPITFTWSRVPAFSRNTGIGSFSGITW